jgi:diguanylate cyclase (GGDEF)-like protein
MHISLSILKYKYNQELFMSLIFLARFQLFLAPIVSLLLILIDFQNKRTIDKTTPRIMTTVILCTLAAMLCELSYQMFAGSYGQVIHIASWALNTLYFLFQNVAFGAVSLFLDYSSNQDTVRLKRIGIIAGCICIVDLILLTINLFTGVMFTITQENLYQEGEHYWLQLAVSYLFLVLALANTALRRKQIEKSKFVLVLTAALPVAVGAMIDYCVPELYIVWPSFFVSLLFCYLFIVRMSMHFDSLTGVNNRRGFDEFMLELSKAVRRKEYSFIMIDMDRFKEINDELGHAQGDVALRDMAEILRSCVRRTDIVARYGGDEFIVVAATQETNVVMENIERSVQEFNERKLRPFKLRMSLGGGLYLPEDQRDPQEFLSYVDGLMYAEKEERRQAVAIIGQISMNQLP